MANEIQFRFDGSAAYAVVRRLADGYVYKPSTQAFVASNSGNYADYDIAISPTANDAGLFVEDFPVVAAGRYEVEVYATAGGSRAVDELPVLSGEMVWDGSQEIQRDDLDSLLDAIKAKTDNLPASPANEATVAALNDISSADVLTQATSALNSYDPPTKAELDVAVTAVKLASDGLDVVAITEPTGVASNFREMIVQLWRRFFGKVALTKTAAGSGTIKTYKQDGSTEATSQTIADTGTTQTQGEAQ